MDISIILLTIGVFIVFIVGLAGLFIPVLPGIPLIWLGTAVYALATGFEHVTGGDLTFFAVLTIFSIGIDYAANVMGAKKYGAGKAGIFGAFAGMLLGLIFAGLPGLIIGSFLGAFAGEIITGKSSGQALQAGWGTLVGFLGGLLIKFVIAFTMIGWFIYRLF